VRENALGVRHGCALVGFITFASSPLLHHLCFITFASSRLLHHVCFMPWASSSFASSQGTRCGPRSTLKFQPPAMAGREHLRDSDSLMRHSMAKKFPMHPKRPERVCWGCDQYCASDAMKCGNGSDRTMHPAELLGDDWASVGNWGFEDESKEASAQNKKAFDQ
jgi:hypothetical protein